MVGLTREVFKPEEVLPSLDIVEEVQGSGCAKPGFVVGLVHVDIDIPLVHLLDKDVVNDRWDGQSDVEGAGGDGLEARESLQGSSRRVGWGGRTRKG